MTTVEYLFGVVEQECSYKIKVSQESLSLRQWVYPIPPSVFPNPITLAVICFFFFFSPFSFGKKSERYPPVPSLPESILSQAAILKPPNATPHLLDPERLHSEAATEHTRRLRVQTNQVKALLLPLLLPTTFSPELSEASPSPSSSQPPISASRILPRRAFTPPSPNAFRQYRHMRSAHQLHVQCSWSSSMWQTAHSTGAALFFDRSSRVWPR